MEKQREKIPPRRNPGDPEHTSWKREVAASQPWPVVALGNKGPGCPVFPSFQEKLKLDILNQLSQR